MEVTPTPSNNFHGKAQLTEDEKRDIWERVQHGELTEETVNAYKKRRNWKTIHRWHWGFSQAKGKREKPYYMKPTSFPYGLTEKAFNEMCRLDQMWAKDANTPFEAENIAPHIADRLQERNQIIELIGQLPDPDDVLARWEEFVPDNSWLDPELAIWPGCLYKDEEGEGYSGAFSLLFEHTQEDPHWAAFGLDRDPKPDEASIKALVANGRLPWTTEYEFFYMGKILYLVGMSHWVYQDRVYSACKALGNSGPMIPFPAFVLRPIRDAIRMHLGKGPLPRADYGLEYLNPSPNARPYNLRFGDQLIASGIDQRENAQENIVANAVATVHSEFRERIMHASEPRDIVIFWHHLKSNAQEFIEWLKGITAVDIERGSCRGCPSASGHAVMPEFATHIRNFLEVSFAAAPTETEKMGQIFEKPRRGTEFSATKIIIQRNVTVQPGEKVKVADFRVGDQRESNQGSEQESDLSPPDSLSSEPPQEAD